MSETQRPFNQETHPDWNAEPGIAIVPGSRYAQHMQQFEQFPSRYGNNPGNAYTFRPFPKMLYKADRFNGKVVCMAAQPDRYDFANDREYDRAAEAAERFTTKCQSIVQDEVEYARAREAGWRDSPDEAVAHVLERDRAEADAAAHRNYEDRNMSEPAKREIAEAQRQTDGHLAEVPSAAERKRRRQ